MSYKGKINQYICDCGAFITTIDIDEGTTSFTVPCENCNRQMYSEMYQVPQDLEPTHEWYKPAKLPKNRGLRHHVSLGGLLLRKIGDKQS